MQPIWMVLCADGAICGWPGRLGSTWEDVFAPPCFEVAHANDVVAGLDMGEYPAPCGPHKVSKYVPAE